MSTVKWGLRGKRAKAKGKVCARCRADKPEQEFGAGHVWCRTCKRVAQQLYRDTPEYRERVSKMVRDPDFKARWAEPKRAWRAGERGRATDREYRTSARGKLVKARSKARCELRSETDPVKAGRLRKVVESCTAELARLDRRLNPPDEETEVA